MVRSSQIVFHRAVRDNWGKIVERGAAAFPAHSWSVSRSGWSQDWRSGLGLVVGFGLRPCLDPAIRDISYPKNREQAAARPPEELSEVVAKDSAWR